VKEIGGYLEYERYFGSEYHDTAIALNSGRNCFRYLIYANDIRTILLPRLCCDAISEVCREEAIHISYYDVNEQFEPILSEAQKDIKWLYIVNMYGMLSADELYALYGMKYNIIWDNAHDFFAKPHPSMNTLYTCRKFFGVPNGGYLYTTNEMEKPIQIETLEVVNLEHLMGRFEKDANTYYQAFQMNEECIQNAPFRMMSKFTRNLMCSYDYSRIKEIRENNFKKLHEYLEDINELNIQTVGTYMYPLLYKDGENLRRKLQKRKIYVPCFWQNVFNQERRNSNSAYFATNVVPLPIDQRYDEEDMIYVASLIRDVLNN